MRILVAYASKHGATRGIAERLAELLDRGGADTVLFPLPPRTDPPPFDAAVVGSAVYMGHWMKDAVALLETHRPVFGARPLWLFSSGPVGPKLLPEPPEIASLRELGSVRDHHVFAGALHRDGLSLGERLAVTVVKAPDGDFRDWADVESWTASILRELVGDAQQSSAQTGAFTR